MIEDETSRRGWPGCEDLQFLDMVKLLIPELDPLAVFRLLRTHSEHSISNQLLCDFDPLEELVSLD